MQPGMVRDRYRLERPLGHGGGAVVWRAHDLRLNRGVAVKRLTPAAMDDPVALERFQREAQAIAGLAHPNIVTVHDVDLDDEAPYLVLELVHGPSLAALLAEGPLPTAQAVDIARQACRALAAAHAAGVIHRDVKPANLLLTPDGVVKVCDFGIAHLQNIPTLSPPPDAGSALGTSHYMAPETISGDPVDARTDLYALGCVLYAMLSGQPPFPGESPVGVAVRHLHDRPAPLGRLRPGLPPDLVALTEELLAKDPSQRPSTADEVDRRLAALADPTGAAPTRVAPAGDGADPTLAVPVAPLRARHARAQGEGPRRRLPVLVGGVAAVLLAVPAVAWFWPGEERGLTTRPPVVATTAPSAAPAASGPAVAATTGPPPAPPTRTSRSPRLPADIVRALRNTLAGLVGDGQVDPAAARELDKRLAETGEAIADGKDGKARNKLREAAQKTVDLRDEGKLSAAGYAALAGPLGELVQVLRVS